MTVLMKLDLVDPRRRGLALGLNESAGYGGVALGAILSGWLASEYAARDVLVAGGAAVAVTALVLSVLFVRDTADHVALEQAAHARAAESAAPLRWAFAEATYRDPALRSCSQAGFTNNLNDALAWGVLPLFLAPDGASASEIGLVAGLSPAVWATAQIGTGHWSDRVGRKPLIVAGMLTQAAALTLLAASGGVVAAAALAAVSLGIGTALVYPTLIAAISDAVSPVERPPAVGIYRFWRDMGYVAGGLVAGIAADAIDYAGAIAIVAALTAASGLWVLVDMPPPPSHERDAEQQRAPRAQLPDEIQAEAAQSSTISPSSMRLITIPQILIGRPRLWPSATQRDATRSPSVTWSST